MTDWSTGRKATDRRSTDREHNWTRPTSWRSAENVHRWPMTTVGERSEDPRRDSSSSLDRCEHRWSEGKRQCNNTVSNREENKSLKTKELLVSLLLAILPINTVSFNVFNFARVIVLMLWEFISSWTNNCPVTLFRSCLKLFAPIDDNRLNRFPSLFGVDLTNRKVLWSDRRWRT